jgi:hypothetical protein
MSVKEAVQNNSNSMNKKINSSITTSLNEEFQTLQVQITIEIKLKLIFDSITKIGSQLRDKVQLAVK